MRKTLITLFSLMACYCANAESILTVEYLDGNKAKEQLALLSKIEFNGNGNITFDYVSGGSKDFGNVSNTQKIVFSDGDLSSSKQGTASSISVYPNPSSETIRIEGMRDGQVVKIYSVAGKLERTSNESTINVSNLSNGEYFVVIGQTVAKLIKK